MGLVIAKPSCQPSSGDLTAAREFNFLPARLDVEPRLELLTRLSVIPRVPPRARGESPPTPPPEQISLA